MTIFRVHRVGSGEIELDVGYFQAVLRPGTDPVEVGRVLVIVRLQIDKLSLSSVTFWPEISGPNGRLGHSQNFFLQVTIFKGGGRFSYRYRIQLAGESAAELIKRNFYLTGLLLLISPQWLPEIFFVLFFVRKPLAICFEFRKLEEPLEITRTGRTTL